MLYLWLWQILPLPGAADVWANKVLQTADAHMPLDLLRCSLAPVASTCRAMIPSRMACVYCGVVCVAGHLGG